MCLGTLPARDISQLNGDTPSSLSKDKNDVSWWWYPEGHSLIRAAWNPFSVSRMLPGCCYCPNHSLEKYSLDGPQIARKPGHLPGEASTLRGFGEDTQGGGWKGPGSGLKVLFVTLWTESFFLCLPHLHIPFLPSLPMCITLCWGVRPAGMCKEGRCGKFHMLAIS